MIIIIYYILANLSMKIPRGYIGEGITISIFHAVFLFIISGSIAGLENWLQANTHLYAGDEDSRK